MRRNLAAQILSFKSGTIGLVIIRERSSFMKQLLRTLLKTTPLYPVLSVFLNNRKIHAIHKKELADWERKGKPARVPHLLKQTALKDFVLSVRKNVNIELENDSIRILPA